MKESDANDTAVLNTTKNNVDSADNAAFTHVQKQSTVINMKESNANNTVKSVVKFELLNSTQVEFQNWVELREINSTQSSWVRLSTQLDQLDELTWTQWHV